MWGDLYPILFVNFRNLFNFPHSCYIFRMTYSSNSSSRKQPTNRSYSNCEPRWRRIMYVYRIHLLLQHMGSSARKSYFEVFFTVDRYRARWPENGLASVTHAEVANWQYGDTIEFVIFLFIILFLPNCCVKFYDYNYSKVVQWCSM